jgi:hypothetical protein
MMASADITFSSYWNTTDSHNSRTQLRLQLDGSASLQFNSLLGLDHTIAYKIESCIRTFIAEVNRRLAAFLDASKLDRVIGCCAEREARRTASSTLQTASPVGIEVFTALIV